MVNDAATSYSTLGSSRLSAPSMDFHLGLICVVLAPALFWTTLTYVICHLSEYALATEASLAVFAATSCFLTYVASALKIRI
jgi:hypothetical protein